MLASVSLDKCGFNVFIDEEVEVERVRSDYLFNFIRLVSEGKNLD